MFENPIHSYGKPKPTHKKRRNMHRPTHVPLQPKTSRHRNTLRSPNKPKRKHRPNRRRSTQRPKFSHRVLSKLVSIGLVTKQTKTIKGGGYYHTYAMLDPALIKKHARERVKEITESLENLIDHFGEEFENT